MINPAWERTERRIAALLGGTRVPVTGRQRGNAPDSERDEQSAVRHEMCHDLLRSCNMLWW